MENTIISEMAAPTLDKNDHLDEEIVHLDADCFEVQVWTGDRPDLEGKPVLVNNKSRKTVAVNYAARAYGVTRKDKIADARKKCQSLKVVTKYERFSKPDQRRARHASYEILDAIVEYFKNYPSNLVKIHYASNDEFYLNVTQLVTHLIDQGKTLKYEDFYPKTILENVTRICSSELESYVKDVCEVPTESGVDDRRLLYAAVIAGELIKFIKSKTGYQTSCGVGKNKLQAKLGCSQNKPSAVTAVLDSTMERLSKEIKIEKIPRLQRQIGSKIMATFNVGDGEEQLPVSTMFDLRSIPMKMLIETIGEKLATEIYQIAFGVDNTPVIHKLTKDSISTGRNIKKRFQNVDDLKSALIDFSEEMYERLEEEASRNKRRASKISIKLQRPFVRDDTNTPRQIDSGSFQCPNDFTPKIIYEAALRVLENNWDKKGQAPLNKIFYAELMVKNFKPLEE